MPYGDYDPDDPDAPQPEDLDGDEDDTIGTLNCPACGALLHKDAAVCPKCGEWIIDDSLARGRSRRWFWPTLVGLLIAVMLVMWHGLGR